MTAKEKGSIIEPRIMTKQTETQQLVTLLLSGKHPKTSQYAGKNVLVVKDEIVPVKSGKKVLTDIKRLEKKYHETPTIVFIPKADVSYILILCHK